MRLRRSIVVLLLGAHALVGCHSAPGGQTSGDGGGNGSDGGVIGGGAPDLATPNPLCATAPADVATSKLRSQDGGVGKEAALLLKPQPYASIVVEIATTAGATPRTAAIDHLTQMIMDVTGKTATV